MALKKTKLRLSEKVRWKKKKRMNEKKISQRIKIMRGVSTAAHEYS